MAAPSAKIHCSRQPQRDRGKEHHERQAEDQQQDIRRDPDDDLRDRRPRDRLQCEQTDLSAAYRRKYYEIDVKIVSRVM